MNISAPAPHKNSRPDNPEISTRVAAITRALAPFLKETVLSGAGLYIVLQLEEVFRGCNLDLPDGGQITRAAAEYIEYERSMLTPSTDPAEQITAADAFVAGLAMQLMEGAGEGTGVDFDLTADLGDTLDGDSAKN